METWKLAFAVAAALAICTGCSASTGDKDKDSDTKPIDEVVNGSDPDLETIPGDGVGPACDKDGNSLCCQGETNGCSDDGRGILVCNTEGTGWDIVDCLDEEGSPTACFASPDKPKGYCGICLPGTKKCDSEDTLMACSQFGQEWVLAACGR